MNYKAYATSKTTPNRRARKGERNTTFRHNKALRAKLNRERRAQREQTNG
jgi:hypothetical protein